MGARRVHRHGVRMHQRATASPPATLHSPDDVSFGTAYFGVRDPDHAGRDFEAMRRSGYSWVLLPMTQEDAVWECATYRHLVQLAEANQLEPIVSLWGGGLFGGEGNEGPLDAAAWLDRARSTGAETLHIDEPKVSPALIDELLEAWPGPAWLTLEPDRAALLKTLQHRRIEVVGTDAYDGSVRERVAATQAFGREAQRLDLAWVRAFRVPRADEPLVRDSLVAMAGLAPRVGVWAWKGSVGRGELRCERPQHVEAAVRAGMAEVRGSARRRLQPREAIQLRPAWAPS
jgi:hypothetical protein